MSAFDPKRTLFTGFSDPLVRRSCCASAPYLSHCRARLLHRRNLMQVKLECTYSEASSLSKATN